jgi:murein endopeptidase
MAALLAADPSATAENFNVFVTQLFACMTAAKDVGDSGSGCVVGADTAEAGGIFGKFKMSKTTGSWSFSGALRTTYVTAAAP